MAFFATGKSCRKGSKTEELNFALVVVLYKYNILGAKFLPADL
jgi:hypothetical protein